MRRYILFYKVTSYLLLHGHWIRTSKPWWINNDCPYLAFIWRCDFSFFLVCGKYHIVEPVYCSTKLIIYMFYLPHRPWIECAGLSVDAVFPDNVSKNIANTLNIFSIVVSMDSFALGNGFIFLEDCLSPVELLLEKSGYYISGSTYLGWIKLVASCMWTPYFYFSTTSLESAPLVASSLVLVLTFIFIMVYTFLSALGGGSGTGAMMSFPGLSEIWTLSGLCCFWMFLPSTSSVSCCLKVDSRKKSGVASSELCQTSSVQLEGTVPSRIWGSVLNFF